MNQTCILLSASYALLVVCTTLDKLNWQHFWQLSRTKGKIALLVLMLGIAPILHASESIPLAPEMFHALRRAGEDDPHTALADALQQLATARDADTRFWLLLIIGRMNVLLEDDRAAKIAFSQADATLSSSPKAGAQMSLWLQVESTPLAFSSEDPQQFRLRMTQIGSNVARIGDPILSCSFKGLNLWGLISSNSFEEAWTAAEELESCSHLTGLRFLEAMALDGMGLIKTYTSPPSSITLDVPKFYERALAALNDGSARWRLSTIEWDTGDALRSLKKFGPSLEHLKRSLALSRAINDRGGIGLTDMAIAHVMLEQGSFTDMLPVLDEAQRLLEPYDNGARMPRVIELRLLALARLKRPEVLAEIAQARIWDKFTTQPSNQVPLALAISEAYASLGRYKQAYEELLRANKLDSAGKTVTSERQVLVLQARYDSVRREAENASLRYRNEAAQLALQAQVAQRQLYWLAIIILAILATGIGIIAWRGFVRRRALADLALKDELTGCPNRRSILAYAQAQLMLSRRLGLPMAVAMIDLDLFKRVNDTYGHSVGDSLLQAFATASSSNLRGQDRLGRWGGEEWLLVMPGTDLPELTTIFGRMQQSFASAVVPGMPTPHGCTFSMGGVAASAGSTLDRLIELADERLYLAKADGRNALRIKS